MRITIVYDNGARRSNLKADWGFACGVDGGGRRILFDTGASGSILLYNLGQLGLAPTSVHEIFISHDHWDHAGGLAPFLEAGGKKLKVYVPYSASVGADAAEVVRVGPPLELHPGVYSTGELQNREQAMAVKTAGCGVIITGCSHPGVEAILAAAAPRGRVRGLVGGLHGFREFNLLENLEFICATHCTQYGAEIEARYPAKYVPGGVGTIIEC
jgi:7,8-dihydropterin-6-yl-methyl-4-(beta-D-ribofuranosyl)aminobenzene 5'-phosphate synthase